MSRGKKKEPGKKAQRVVGRRSEDGSHTVYTYTQLTPYDKPYQCRPTKKTSRSDGASARWWELRKRERKNSLVTRLIPSI